MVVFVPLARARCDAMHGAGKVAQPAEVAEALRTRAACDDRHKPDVAIRLAFAGLGVLALGALVYVLERPAATVYLLPEAVSLASGTGTGFGVLGSHLPSLAHAFGFILLTVAVSRPPARVLAICSFWWGVDSLFEIGQHVSIAPHVAGALPAWFQGIPILDNTAAFFLRGTFDEGDLLATALGTLLAYFTIRAACRQR